MKYVKPFCAFTLSDCRRLGPGLVLAQLISVAEDTRMTTDIIAERGFTY
jgi:hypothetical protein